MPALLLGLLSGVLLSLLRVPLGLDLFEVPAVEAEVSVFWRAVALFVVAIGLAVRPRVAASVGFLLALAAGFAAHGLLLANELAPHSRPALAATAVLGALGLIAIARRERPVEPAPEPSRRQRMLEGFERLGLAAAGAGVALALEGVARHVRLFGAALSQDDSLLAVVFLGLVAAGAAAFGWIAALRRLRGLSLAVGLAAAAASTCISMRVISSISSPRGLDLYLREYSLDMSLHGTLAYDALIAAACLVAPAFLLGTALRGAARRGSLASVSAGAALGLLLVPQVLASQAGLLSEEKTVFSAELIPLGTLVAVAGAALAILCAPDAAARARKANASAELDPSPDATGVSLSAGAAAGDVAPASVDSPSGLTSPAAGSASDGTPSPAGAAKDPTSSAAIRAPAGSSALARAIAFVLVLALSLPLFLIEVRPQPVLSPWAQRPVLPHLTFDSPAGLVSIDPSPGELKVVTLDRRELSPPLAGASADAQRFALAFEQLPDEVRIQKELRVLLVGQLTPLRAFALQRSGATRVDRTGAWHAAMERLEAHLFEGGTPPAGERLAPDEARRRIAAGAYDLVIVPPASGDAPFVPALDAPGKTRIVVWLRLDQPAWQRDLGPALVLSSDGLLQPCIAVVSPTPQPGPPGPQAALVVRAGPPGRAPLPITWLQRRQSDKFNERSDASRARFFERLAAAAPGTPAGELCTGLARFHAEQVPSSPFERPEEATELSREVLDLLLATSLREQNAFVRSLWDGLARVLAVKRDVEGIYRYVEPVAKQYGPWARLEIALAIADLESLDPASAVARLAPLAPEGTQDIELWYLLGTAQGQAGDHAAALASFERALLLRPDNAALRRQRALAAQRAGDPRGSGWIEDLLREDPDDAELQRFAGPGPYPAPPPGPPAGGARHGDDQHG